VKAPTSTGPPRGTSPPFGPPNAAIPFSTEAGVSSSPIDLLFRYPSRPSVLPPQHRTAPYRAHVYGKATTRSTVHGRYESSSADISAANAFVRKGADTGAPVRRTLLGSGSRHNLRLRPGGRPATGLVPRDCHRPRCVGQVSRQPQVDHEDLIQMSVSPHSGGTNSLAGELARTHLGTSNASLNLLLNDASVDVGNPEAIRQATIVTEGTIEVVSITILHRCD